MKTLSIYRQEVGLAARLGWPPHAEPYRKARLKAWKAITSRHPWPIVERHIEAIVHILNRVYYPLVGIA